MTSEDFLFPSNLPSIIDQQALLLSKFQEKFKAQFGVAMSRVEEHRKEIRRLRPLVEIKSSSETYTQAQEQLAAHARGRDFAEEWLEKHEEIAPLLLNVNALQIKVDDPRIAPLWEEFVLLKAFLQLQGEQENAPFYAAEQGHEST